VNLDIGDAAELVELLQFAHDRLAVDADGLLDADSARQTAAGMGSREARAPPSSAAKSCTRLC
jgi:hypothetical protein